MAHLTNLKKNNIDNIIKNYNILNYVNYTPIYDGVQNSNYIINTNKKKYILTIFEDKYVIKNIKFFLNLMLFCNKYNFSCPLPLMDRNANFINFISHKPSCLFSFIEGKSFSNFTNGQIKNVGIHLAKLHLITSDFEQKIKTRFNNHFYNNAIKIHKAYFLKHNSELTNIFNYILNDYKNLEKINLPKAIIHGDLFPDNVLFNNKNEVTGFLDFYFSDINYLISDIAIVIISWCFYFNKNKKYELDYNKVNILLNNYNNFRKISSKELDSLIILCKIYCMRFMFTRLIAKDNNYIKKNIFTKNPDEYLEKLLYFNNNIDLGMNLNYA